MAYFDQLRNALDLEKSVKDNVSEGSDHVDVNGNRRHIYSYLQDFLFSPERANSPVSTLSGGERRRVEIARALASQPKFILLDEPFAGVDPIAVGEIQRIVRFLKDRQIGVLITDHNVRETLGICDYAYIISEGKVLASGEPSSIIDNEAVRKVYLGENFKM